MIVLGLTGKNVFARLLAGNVPVDLIKNTRIPVLILPPDWNETVQGSGFSWNECPPRHRHPCAAEAIVAFPRPLFQLPWQCFL